MDHLLLNFDLFFFLVDFPITKLYEGAEIIFITSLNVWSFYKYEQWRQMILISAFIILFASGKDFVFSNGTLNQCRRVLTSCQEVEYNSTTL